MPGFPSVIKGANPALGAEVAVTVPGQYAWEPITITITITTSATVADRVPQVVIDDGTDTFVFLPAEVAQAGSLTRTYVFARDAGTPWRRPDNDAQVYPLPRLVLLPGFRIRTETRVIQAGDDYRVPILHVWQTPIGELVGGGRGLMAETLLADLRIGEAAVGS